MTDRYQQQRFEYKYIIPEEEALEVRDFVGRYMVLDAFGAKSPDLSYSVHSLYLDSNELDIYLRTVNGDKNRYKLRIRYYDENGSPALYFEVKQRTDNIISKTRSKVRRDSLTRLLGGDAPQMEDLFEPTKDNLRKLDFFCRLRNSIDAQPMSQVSYRREAWLPSDGNSARVTFDRDVRSGADREAKMSTETSHLPCIFGPQVILELKFTDRFPDWMRDLVREFHLVQVSAAKYVEGVIINGEDHLIQAGADAGLLTSRGQRKLAQRRKNLEKLIAA
jgi:SPX domain protein involved in polyphosphate accumulation